MSNIQETIDEMRHKNPYHRPFVDLVKTLLETYDFDQETVVIPLDTLRAAAFVAFELGMQGYQPTIK